MGKLLNEIKRDWNRNRSSYILQLIILVIFGYLITIWLPNELKPQTDIDVSCKISEGINSNYSVEVLFNNKADFGSKNFYVYLWEVTSNSYSSDYSVSEHCTRINKLEVDWTSRFKIYCDFIPPESKFGFRIDTDLNDKIINENELKIEWWGESTPYHSEFIICS